MIKKKNIFNLFILFLIIHAVIWVLIPSLTNKNLPLDTIEALAWGSNLEWGFSKHPPLSAFAVEFFFQFFNNQDWAYYLLSQIFVLISFIFVWKLSREFFDNKLFSLISVLLLEGIFFFNYTTPEFNVNVCQLPFWSIAVYYTWLCIKENKTSSWIILGFFSSLGFLSKYLFLYLIVSVTIIFLYHAIKYKKFNQKYFIPIIIIPILLSPHFIWLFNNNFITIFYGINRTGLENANIFDNFINPLTFLLKQIGILIPIFCIFLLTLEKIKKNINFKDKKLLFLLAVNILPLFLVLLTSLLTGAKIRTMWMTPFYLFLGLLLTYLFKENINLKKLNKFFISFLFIFLLSPSIYLYVSLTNENKRTDYPGSEIAYLIQNKWDKNFVNKITVIVGDEWAGGNLSYHLNSRPKWFSSLDNNLKKIEPNAGFVYVGNPNVLKKVCPGEYGVIKPIGVCMIGIK
jgi:4-amino-4-deoxy-L-arabinose transferase-like glycosyltransferase